jgi:hypothetical protein
MALRSVPCQELQHALCEFRPARSVGAGRPFDSHQLDRRIEDPHSLDLPLALFGALQGVRIEQRCAIAGYI